MMLWIEDVIELRLGVKIGKEQIRSAMKEHSFVARFRENWAQC
jgi:hypothetical protein